MKTNRYRMNPNDKPNSSSSDLMLRAGQIGCLLLMLVPVGFLIHSLATPDSPAEAERGQAVITSMIALGITGVFVRGVLGLSDVEPWVPWDWWREKSWFRRYGYYGAAAWLLLFDSGLGGWHVLMSMQSIGPLGETVSELLIHGFLFSQVLLIVGCAFVAGGGILLWLAEASAALREKRDE